MVTNKTGILRKLGITEIYVAPFIYYGFMVPVYFVIAIVEVTYKTAKRKKRKVRKKKSTENLSSSSRTYAYQCSFCGKWQDDVSKIFTGPNVCICDECVTVCFQVLVDEGIYTNGEKDLLVKLLETQKTGMYKEE